MIKSMTGFGKSEATLQNKKITVEIRSLNSKQLDLNIKLPAIYRQAEYEIRNLITKSLQRGKVDVFVNTESSVVETTAHINKDTFKAYYKQISDLCTEQGTTDVFGNTISAAIMQTVMRLPDVVSTEAETVSETETQTLLDTVQKAIEHLDAFREQEGTILMADLLKRIDKIEQYKQEIAPFEKARIESIRTRILDSISQMKVNIDSNRLEQEMIYYIEKLDITEEKVRLTNHCKYFREVAAEEDSVGRKLGFISQEIGREINTLGSKANESNMQIFVVKMKDELEKIKEQSLNIL